MINFEKIKNMSVEEMAILLSNADDCVNICKYWEDCNFECKVTCAERIKQWLMQEAETDGN